jgi:hypothetical protein
MIEGIDLLSCIGTFSLEKAKQHPWMRQRVLRQPSTLEAITSVYQSCVTAFTCSAKNHLVGDAVNDVLKNYRRNGPLMNEMHLQQMFFMFMKGRRRASDECHDGGGRLRRHRGADSYGIHASHD